MLVGCFFVVFCVCFLFVFGFFCLDLTCKEPQEAVLSSNYKSVIVGHPELPRIINAVCHMPVTHSFLRTLMLAVICRFVSLLSCLVSVTSLLGV